jgi:hypothetical protein
MLFRKADEAVYFHNMAGSGIRDDCAKGIFMPKLQCVSRLTTPNAGTEKHCQ